MDPKIIGHFALDLKMFSDGNIWRSVRWLVAVAVSNDGGAPDGSSHSCSIPHHLSVAIEATG